MRCTGKRAALPTTGIETVAGGAKTNSEAIASVLFSGTEKKRQCARGRHGLPVRRYACGMMKLHNYFRSSSSFRVRIALHLKGLEFDYIPVHIARGEHRTGPFSAISADMLVP